MPHVIRLRLLMELLYTGQFSVGSWKQHGYSFKTEQVYQVLYEYTYKSSEPCAFKTKVNKTNIILYINIRLVSQRRARDLALRHETFFQCLSYSFWDSCKAEIHSITLRGNAAIPQSGTKTTTEFDTYRQTLMKNDTFEILRCSYLEQCMAYTFFNHFATF